MSTAVKNKKRHGKTIVLHNVHAEERRKQPRRRRVRALRTRTSSESTYRLRSAPPCPCESARRGSTTLAITTRAWISSAFWDVRRVRLFGRVPLQRSGPLLEPGAVRNEYVRPEAGQPPRPVFESPLPQVSASCVFLVSFHSVSSFF